jgi:hypothetical protein
VISLWLYKEVRKEVVVQKSQIRCVSRVFQNFKVKTYQFLARNDRLVRSSTVLKKQDSFRKPDLSAPRHISRDKMACRPSQAALPPSSELETG